MGDPVKEILAQIRLLSLEDQVALLEQLRADLSQRIKAKEDAEPFLDVREFRGIGHGTWTDIGGVDEFIRQERASQEGLSINRQEIQPERRHKAREFRGVGRETWKSIDVEEYIRQLREA